MTIHDPETEVWPPDPLTVDLNGPEWVTVEQAAHLARTDARTIRRWIRERDIAIYTPGGKAWVNRKRLFLPQPPEMSRNVHSEAPHLPGILHSD